MNSVTTTNYTSDLSWRLRAAALCLTIDAVAILGLFTLPRHTWPVFFPLFIYTTVVSLPAMLLWGDDVDILRIRAMIAADFRSVTATFLGMVGEGRQHGLKQDEIEQLRKVLLGPESSIQRVQAAYWRNRRHDRRPSERQLLIANLILLGVGAALGDVVENRLVPDAAAVPSLWSMGLFGVFAVLIVALALLLTARSVARFYRAMEQWERHNLGTMRGAMGQRPREATYESLSLLNEEAWHKLAEELKYASNYLDVSPKMEESVTRLRGSDDDGNWRPSGLLSVCLTNFSFGAGLILGAYLPPLLGLAR